MRTEIAENFRKNFPVALSDADLAEIMSAFDVSFRAAAGELRAADPSDFEAIRHVTHTIKGFAGNVGAERLAGLAEALNASAHAADAAACAAGKAALFAAWDSYAAEIPPCS